MSFDSTYLQFVHELRQTFPEYADALTSAANLSDKQSVFLSVWKSYTPRIAIQDATLFTGAGVELVPGFPMTGKLWGEISSGTRAAIWKYLQSLLLLGEGEFPGFQEDFAEILKKLQSGGLGDMKQMFEKMSENFGFKDMSGAAEHFKLPERMLKGPIAKIAAEIVKEFQPEDFGITPEMLQSNDPSRIFSFLQEIFTKNPEMLATAAQKIAKKIQAKFQRGEIKREDIMREVEELMAEFSENDMFSELFGSLGEMLKGSEKKSGNEGSSRRREVQERLRKKAAEKEAKKATGNVVTSAAEQRADAMAAQLLQEDAASKLRKQKKK